MEEKETTKTPDYEESISLFFEETSLPRQKKLIEWDENLMKEDRILSSHIHLEIFGNDKIVFTGKNGCGKTTLMKQIFEKLKDRKDIRVGYMPQDYEEAWQGSKTPISFLSSDEANLSEVRTLLGCMHFTQVEMIGDIYALSGGSQAKLLLAKLIFDQCNVLLLDEPTRNVSPLSNPMIRESLIHFNGAIISVSHDRKYIDEVCNQVYELNSKGLFRIK